MLIRSTWLCMTAIGCFVVLAGCDTKQPANTAAKTEAAKPEAAKPADAAPAADAGHDHDGHDHAGHDHATADAAKAPAADAGKPDAVELVGLTMTSPAGWERVNVQPSSMGPVAVFKIKAASGDCEVRITHYESMKGKDDMNINRWLGMVIKPDGQPYTREAAKIETQTIGDVKLTIVDLPGTVTATMGGPDAAIPVGRMIAAIVDHARGPHYVRVYGPADSIAAVEADVHAFLKSAKSKS